MTTYNSDINALLFNEKPVQMLDYINQKGEGYASKMARVVDTTYSHAVKVMNRMEDLGLVTSTQNGRRKTYELTDDGQRIADELSRLRDEIYDVEVEG